MDFENQAKLFFYRLIVPSAPAVAGSVAVPPVTESFLRIKKTQPT